MIFQQFQNALVSINLRLLEQIKPFKTELFLNERVDEVHQKQNWVVKKIIKKFVAPNIIIAGGVGSFEFEKYH